MGGAFLNQLKDGRPAQLDCARLRYQAGLLAARGSVVAAVVQSST